MYSDNSFFSSTFTFVTSSSTGSSSSAALAHGSNTSTTSSGGGVGGQLNSAYAGGGSHHQPQPQIHYLQLPSRISQQHQHQPQQRETRTMSSRSTAHGRARSRPYNIVKPIQKRVERARRDSISTTPTHRSSSTARTGGGARTPNYLFIDQQQERPSGLTPLSSSGQIHTPLANFEASFDGIAALGFDLDAFGSNERLMATSPTLSASS